MEALAVVFHLGPPGYETKRVGSLRFFSSQFLDKMSRNADGW
jgi:hypothetical protein